MTDSGASWPQTFHDWFCADAARAAASPQAALYANVDFARSRAGLLARAPVRPERLAYPLFQRATPPTLLIDDVEALWAPIAADDDWALFAAKIADLAALREALDLEPVWARDMPPAAAD
jgi:hypothetical protein